MTHVKCSTFVVYLIILPAHQNIATYPQSVSAEVTDLQLMNERQLFSSRQTDTSLAGWPLENSNLCMLHINNNLVN